MITAFTLPDLGEGMEEAEIMSWLVGVGDQVELDQPFVEVQTDKAVVEIPSPYAGVIATLCADEGAVVKVGSVLAEFDLPTVAGTEPDPVTKVEPVSMVERDPGLEAQRSAAAPRDHVDPSVPGRRAKASPAVRKLAGELGVDLGSIAGTGPGGRVTADDVSLAARESMAPSAAETRQGTAVAELDIPQHVSSYSSAETSPPESATVVPLRGIRRRMVQVMSASWTIPHITGMDEFDASKLIQARQDIVHREPDGPGITFLSFFVKAAAQALARHPYINASLDLEAEELRLHNAINIGIAVASPTGLVVPVVKNAGRMSLRAIAAEVARLTISAREGRLTPNEMADGTFTITNYGALGRGRFATPIIRSPEVAIIGFGAITKRPWTVDERVEVRPVLPWSFSADHRVIDGQLSGEFQQDVIARLANPVLMMLDT